VSQSQGASLKRKWGERGCIKMPSGITYVTSLDLNGLPIEPLKQGKHSNTLVDFKLEIMSPSPSKIGGSCLRPQRSSFGAI
jgi:hypothetical protein